MNFPKHLSKLKSKNPKIFESEKIIISISSLEKILEYTYEEGYFEAEEYYIQLGYMGKGEDFKSNEDFNNIFGDLFRINKK